MMNHPELRSTGFFLDYSNLSSEEILNGMIYRWQERADGEPLLLRGQILNKAIEEEEDLWVKPIGAKIGYWIIPSYAKRTIRERLRRSFSKGMSVVILNRFSRISGASSKDDEYPSKMFEGDLV